jgi:hypothetical protein
MHLQTIHWIAGSILALAWFSRIAEAAIGMPTVADIARPEWDRKPATPNGEPRVSIIVPARNEAESIRATLTQLLALDYSNYEVIAVNDRSTDDTGRIMNEVSCGADTPVRLPAAEMKSAGSWDCPRTAETFSSVVKRTGVSAPHGSISSPNVARPGSGGCFRRNIGDAISRAWGPASRTTPIPPRPGGVAMATMVSSRFTGRL